MLPMIKKKCSLGWDPLVYDDFRCTVLRVLRNYFATDFWQKKWNTNPPCSKPPGTKQNAIFTWMPSSSWIGPLLPAALKWLWHFYQTGKKKNKQIILVQLSWCHGCDLYQCQLQLNPRQWVAWKEKQRRWWLPGVGMK